MPTHSANRGARPPILLGLQGGGAHGAFGWGVLDRLLEADCFEIEAISGTSAGAMNGAMLAYGLSAGDAGSAGSAQNARDMLQRFWERTAGQAAYSPFRPSAIDQFLGNGDLAFSPGYRMLEIWPRVISPHHLNPLDMNPLRHLLDGLIDFERLRQGSSPALFIAATQVLSGNLRIFHRREITPDSLLASACLPFMMRAITIDGEPYWDGAYLANPALSPLVTHAQACDLIVVQVSPFAIATLPNSTTDIIDRVTAIASNGALTREIEQITLANQRIQRGEPPRPDQRPIRLHLISAEKPMQPFSPSSKLNADRSFIEQLFRLGRETADHWLAAHGKDVGVRASYTPHPL